VVISSGTVIQFPTVAHSVCETFAAFATMDYNVRRVAIGADKVAIDIARKDNRFDARIFWPREGNDRLRVKIMVPRGIYMLYHFRIDPALNPVVELALLSRSEYAENGGNRTPELKCVQKFISHRFNELVCSEIDPKEKFLGQCRPSQ